MAVVGFRFTKVSAEKTGSPEGGINISSSPTIKDVRIAELSNIKDVLEIDFQFSTVYENLGKIEFEGSVLYQGSPKEILKHWKDRKELEEKAAVDILNFIFRKCLSEAIHLAEIMQFPPPVRFPVVTAKKPESGYVG